MNKTLLPATLLTLAVLTLGGCVLPPKLPPATPALAGNQLGLDGPAGRPAPAGWWRAFGDPQLNRLVEQTLAGNPQLMQAQARVRLAQAQVRSSVAASHPGVTLDGQDQYQRFSQRFIYPPPYAGQWYWLGQIGANLSWDLDFFGRQAAVIARNRDLERAAQLNVELTHNLLAGALAQAYIDLDRAWALSDIAALGEQQRKDILAIARQRVAAGLDSDAALKTDEAAIAQARLAREQAQASVALAVHRLAAISGQGADAYARIKRPRLNLATALPLPRKLPLDLLARRPDVLAARARADAAVHGQAAAKAAFYPDINLTAFAGTAALGFRNLFEWADRTAGAGPAIHLPLFESGQLKASYRGAAAEADSAIDDYNDTVLQAVRQTADQLSLIDSYRRQLDLNAQALSASEGARRIERDRYRAGLSNRLAALDAETAVLAAQRDRTELNAGQAIARVTLLLALGGSFDPSHLDVANGKQP